MKKFQKARKVKSKLGGKLLKEVKIERAKIIGELKQYFAIEELACPHTVQRFGEGSWQFFSTDFLENLLILRRDVLQVPLVCNTYKGGGAYTQRGLRCNVCELVKTATRQNRNYLSAHIFGVGADFSSAEMSAKEMRGKIRSNIDKFTHPIRIERDVSWLHFDVRDRLRGKLDEFEG